MIKEMHQAKYLLYTDRRQINNSIKNNNKKKKQGNETMTMTMITATTMATDNDNTTITTLENIFYCNWYYCYNASRNIDLVYSSTKREERQLKYSNWHALKNY